MAKEYRECIAMVNGKEIKLRCPICGCDMFRSRYIGNLPYTDLSFVERDATQYICRDCGHMLWFSGSVDLSYEEGLSPVERFEEQFAGYSKKKLEKILESDQYFPEAKTAAKNLLRKQGER